MEGNKRLKEPNSNYEEHEIDPRTDLAIERTALALERTQLAWIRTLLSMIGGGFVIDKGLAVLHQARVESGRAWVNHAHIAGLLITGSGTFLMAMVTILYMRRSHALNDMIKRKNSFFAPASLLSMMSLLIGSILTYFIVIAKNF